jgi:hypothetical protein
VVSDETAGRIHWSFWAVGAVALIWNVMGVMNFFMQMNPDALAAMSESQRAIVASRPPWATGAFAIAVFVGSSGCLLLLLRKSTATYLFVVSLIAMIVHMVPYLGMSGSTIKFGPLEISMFILMPLAVAAFLTWYAKLARSKGWIR